MNNPQNAAQKMAEQDSAVYARLAHNSVLTYCWGILNGHRAFYDLVPPSREQLEISRDLLLKSPDAFGQQYLPTIQRELETRGAEMIVKINWHHIREAAQ